MHTSGKVFLWLIVPLIMAAMVLSTYMVGIRNSWLKVINDNNERIARNAEELESQKKKLAQTQAEYDRLMLGWERYFTDVPAQVTPQGALQLGIGPPSLDDKDAAGNAEMPTIYAFQPLQDGSYGFVGEFKGRRLDAAGGTFDFDPDWRIRPGQVQNWRSGNWRIRTLIPSQEITRFADLERQLLLDDELIVAKQADLARQEELLTLATKQLQRRVEEIEGSEELAAQEGKIPDELIKGVLATLLNAEESRNAVFANAARLRKELLDTQREFDRVNELNLKLAESLDASDTTPEVSSR